MHERGRLAEWEGQDHMEILAPAGGMEQLQAAVRSGADAVYFGAQLFNARRNAANFTDEEIPKAIAYCHARGVRVHMTLNTLVQDGEMDGVCRTLEQIARAGADAVIVQDLAVARLARQICPDLKLHASTQMAVHNAAGLRLLEEMGFSRAVLARELSREEIGRLAAGTSLEVEVFGHGALCMSVSGQCYLSGMLGGRSGNRGLCAQPCRLDFKAGQRGYALSLKDLSLIEQMRRLEQLGVASLKIEGRMKRPEYVACATRACKQALSGEQPDLESLKAVFSRSGFTNGYFAAKRDLTMFGTRTREDVQQAGGVLGRIAATYRHEAQTVPVDMHLTVLAGASPELQVDGQGKRVCVQAQGEKPQKAINRPLDEAQACQALEKTGGTPFYLRELHTQIEPGLRLPISALNSLRKAALDELEALLGQPPVREIDSLRLEKAPCARVEEGEGAPRLRIRLEKVEQLSQELVIAAERLILPLNELAAHPEMLDALGDKLIGEIPMAVFPDHEEQTTSLLEELKRRGLAGAQAENLGALRMAQELGLRVHGGYGLNILNSLALEEAGRLGVADQTISFEANLRDIRHLQRHVPCGVIAYGHLPLMTLRACPMQGARGCGDCDGRRTLTDRKGEKFTVLCRERRYSQLLNGHVLSLADQQAQLQGLDFVTLYFTLEEQQACRRALEDYLAGRMPQGQYTRGLYLRQLQ